MLEGNKSISKDDFKSKLKMFSGNTKGENEQENKNIIPISSRENFESRLKMFSNIGKENPQQRPNTLRSYNVSLNEIIRNKDLNDNSSLNNESKNVNINKNNDIEKKMLIKLLKI